jgi:hypothetical protein
VLSKRRLAIAGAAVVLIGAGTAIAVSSSAADANPGLNFTSIPANVDTRGIVVPNALSPQLRQASVAEGANTLENPDGIVAYYGYNANGTLAPDPTLVQSPGHNVEASKTEPDKNTYLRLAGLHGADPKYDYGTHFLYQGHETGSAGYLTRINLDADATHRVTLIADKEADGTRFR